MANDQVTEQTEPAFFKVKNISMRLVHIGGVQILPEQIVPVLDDEEGINRRDVELSDYLEETDEDATVAGVIPVKPVAKETKKSGTKKTATGAGWSANKQ